ncbi:MAG: hypothetical protein IPM16_06725 [Chloroflexi bacterium]|nr:hypothetical protein [Chloroflexota bacterium]
MSLAGMTAVLLLLALMVSPAPVAAQDAGAIKAAQDAGVAIVALGGGIVGLRYLHLIIRDIGKSSQYAINAAGKWIDELSNRSNKQAGEIKQLRGRVSSEHVRTRRDVARLGTAMSADKEENAQIRSDVRELIDKVEPVLGVINVIRLEIEAGKAKDRSQDAENASVLQSVEQIRTGLEELKSLVEKGYPHVSREAEPMGGAAADSAGAGADGGGGDGGASAPEPLSPGPSPSGRGESSGGVGAAGGDGGTERAG